MMCSTSLWLQYEVYYPYYAAMLLGSGTSYDVQMDLLQQTQKTAASPERLSTPLGTTTVPRPPHTSALWVPGERIAADARLGERGAWRGALPGTGRSLPGKGADPRERRDFPTLPEPFPSRVRRHTNFNMIINTLTSR